MQLFLTVVIVNVIAGCRKNACRCFFLFLHLEKVATFLQLLGRFDLADCCFWNNKVYYSFHLKQADENISRGAKLHHIMQPGYTPLCLYAGLSLFQLEVLFGDHS